MQYIRHLKKKENLKCKKMGFGSWMDSLNCASSNSAQPKKIKKQKKKKQVLNQSASAPGEEVPIDDNIDAVSYIYDTENVDSFWDIGKYKIALKRCDNGYKLGSDLSEMISDRAKLEDNYGKSIKAWSTKWKNQLEKESPEYETTKEAWSAFLEAGSKQANVHIDLSKTLINYPVFKIKDWLKRSYQKSFINYKQTKEFEENFEEAQSAWIELYDRMKKSKKEYEESIQHSKKTQEESVSAESNPKFTPEQRTKLEQRAEKAVEEQARFKEKYKESVIQMNLYQPRYIENMTEAFNKTQNFEQERMLFFKQVFLECHEILQIHQDERFDELFEELVGRVNSINPQDDVEWWSNHYGLGTQPNWPEFEDMDD